MESNTGNTSSCEQLLCDIALGIVAMAGKRLGAVLGLEVGRAGLAAIATGVGEEHSLGLEEGRAGVASAAGSAGFGLLNQESGRLQLQLCDRRSVLLLAALLLLPPELACEHRSAKASSS
jgi:hypothetical protein